MKHILSEDEVVLWKSANIDLGNSKHMFVVYYYHTVKGDRAKSFYKCAIRIDSKENWENLKESLIKTNPAESFKTSMIGLDDDYRMFYSRHTFNKADMYKWIGTKFSPAKISTMEKFVSEELSANKVEPFLRKYNINGTEVDITEVSKIPEGQWFSTFKEKKIRKSYGKVIQ